MTNIWNIYAEIYDYIIGNTEKNHELIDFIKLYLKKEDILYDGACGTGIFSIELSKYVKQIHACDLSENMIKKTKQKVNRHNITNIETHVQDITDIHFEDNTFDAAITPNIIHLLDNPKKALSELERIVKPDGIIIMPTYITKQNNPHIQKIGSLIFGLVGFKSNSWTESEYINILNENNMNIIDYRTFKLRRYECTVIMKNRSH